MKIQILTNLIQFRVPESPKNLEKKSQYHGSQYQKAFFNFWNSTREMVNFRIIFFTQRPFRCWSRSSLPNFCARPIDHFVSEFLNATKRSSHHQCLKSPSRPGRIFDPSRPGPGEFSAQVAPVRRNFRPKSARPVEIFGPSRPGPEKFSEPNGRDFKHWSSYFLFV